MNELYSIIEEAIRASSYILIKDANEIVKLRASASPSLGQFYSKSITKFHSTIRKKLSVLELNYNIISAGDVPALKQINTENLTEEKQKRIIISIDGQDMLAIGSVLFSISVCAQEKNPETSRFDTVFSCLYSPCDGKFFSASKRSGFSVNRVRSKRTNLIRNHTVFCTSINLLKKENFSSATVISNLNLGMASVACGQYDLFLGKCLDNKEAFSGIFMLQEAGVTVKLSKNADNSFCIEAGYRPKTFSGNNNK